MGLWDSLRNLLEGDGRKHREVTRTNAKQSVTNARAEIQKSRDLRELLALERQYGTRVKGKGNRSDSRSRA